MTPLFRIWGITSACLALLLALRGAFALAVACFLLSPAPVLLFSHGNADGKRLSLSWMGGILIAIAVVLIVLALVVYVGGIPQIHEWPAALRGHAK